MEVILLKVAIAIAIISPIVGGIVGYQKGDFNRSQGALLGAIIGFCGSVGVMLIAFLMAHGIMFIFS